MNFVGNGCCRYDGYKSVLTIWLDKPNCRNDCQRDSLCVAAETVQTFVRIFRRRVPVGMGQNFDTTL